MYFRLSVLYSPGDSNFTDDVHYYRAGLPETYLPMCGQIGATGQCVRLLSPSFPLPSFSPPVMSSSRPQYPDNVVGPGDRYDDAYFEINYLRAYTTNPSLPAPTIGNGIALSSGSSSSSNPTMTPSPTAPAGSTLGAGPTPTAAGDDSDDGSGGSESTSAAMRLRVPGLEMMVLWMVCGLLA